MDALISSLEAERAVIGAILLDEQAGTHDAIRTAREICAPGDFGSAVLGSLFDVMTGRYATQQPIDPVTLWQAVKGHDVLRLNLKSAADLFSFVEATPTSANVGWYAKQVADAGQSRRLLSASARFAQLAASVDMPAGEKLAIARSEIDAIASDYVTVGTDVPTLGDVLSKPDSEIRWVIPDLLARADRLVLTGQEGLGKTTFLRQVAILAAAGIHPTTFEHIDAVKVLVVDTENDEDQWRHETRAVALAARQAGSANPGDNVRLHAKAKRLNITTERDLGLVHALVDRYDPQILVIGPLYKLSPKGLNDENDAAQVIAALDSLRERGPCLLMEAHAGKGTGADGQRALAPRGSSALLGWPEFGIGLAWDTSMLSDGDRPTIATLKRWRGDRQRGRQWPVQVRQGGRWPWMRVEAVRAAWSPSGALGQAS